MRSGVVMLLASAFIFGVLVVIAVFGHLNFGFPG